MGTPIGSLDDLTIRARAVLGQVSIVAAENPLATQALFSKHRISNTITSYGRRDENKIAILLDRLKRRPRYRASSLTAACRSSMIQGDS